MEAANMSSVFYRNPGNTYSVALSGDGVYLYDADGKQYLDGSGGAAISCLARVRRGWLPRHSRCSLRTSGRATSASYRT